MKSALIGIAAVVVIGGGGYLLMHQGGASEVNAQELLSKVVSTSAGSVTMDGSIDVELSSNGGDKTAKTSTTDVDADFNMYISHVDDAKVLESNSTGTINVSYDMNDGTKETKGKLMADFSELGKVFYLRLGLGEDVLKATPMFAVVNAKWIKIDLEELKALGVLPPEVLTQLESTATSTEKEAAVKKAVLDSGVIVVEGAKDGGSVNGADTYELDLSLDSTKIGDLLVALAKIEDPSTTLTDEQNKQLDQVEEMYAKILKDFSIKVWVAKDSNLPAKVEANLKFADAESGTDGNMALTVNYKDYNKPVEVIAPAPATSIMTILAPLFGGMNPATLH